MDVKQALYFLSDLLAETIDQDQPLADQVQNAIDVILKHLDWQPMETAPTGRYVLAKNDLNGDVFLARRYDTGNWFPADVPCVSLHITSWKEVE